VRRNRASETIDEDSLIYSEPAQAAADRDTAECGPGVAVLQRSEPGVGYFTRSPWALVHYLMLDPEAQQRQTSEEFRLPLGTKGERRSKAAQASFRGFEAFWAGHSKGIRGRPRFARGLVKNGQQAAEQNLPRCAPWSAGEVLALRGDSAPHAQK